MIAVASAETLKVAAGLALVVLVWWNFDPSHHEKDGASPMASTAPEQVPQHPTQEPAGEPPAISSASHSYHHHQQPKSCGSAGAVSAGAPVDANSRSSVPGAENNNFPHAQGSLSSSPTVPPPTPLQPFEARYSNERREAGHRDEGATPPGQPKAKRSCMRRAESMPNMQATVGITRSSSANALLSLFGVQSSSPQSQRPKLRFNERATLVKIDSHHDLSEAERSSVYYGKDDMRSFVGYELKRRAAKGIASMSALAPEAEAAGELDDVSAASSASSSSSATPATTGTTTTPSIATPTPTSTVTTRVESASHEKPTAHGSGNEGRSDSGNSGRNGSGENTSDSGSSCSTPMSGSADDTVSSGTAVVQPEFTSPPPSSPTYVLPDPARSRNNSSGEYEEDDSNIEF